MHAMPAHLLLRFDVGKWLGALPVVLLTLGAFVGSSAPLVAADPAPAAIDFNRDIRPILSNACFKCHGPDAKQRKGVTKELRLDLERAAFADLGGYTAIVRGKPDESELIQRITSDD